MLKARTAELSVQDLGDEALVYDARVDRAHALSVPATAVWRALHGDRRPEQVVLPDGTPMTEAEVHEAIDVLADLDLVFFDDRPLAAPAAEPALWSRRQAVVKMAAAASIPLVLSVAAPASAQLISGQQCQAAKDCAPGLNCVSGGNGNNKFCRPYG